MVDKQFYTVYELAAAINRSRPLVYNLIHAGKIKVVHPGHSILIETKEFRRLVDIYSKGLAFARKSETVIDR